MRTLGALGRFVRGCSFGAMSGKGVNCPGSGDNFTAVMDAAGYPSNQPRLDLGFGPAGWSEFGDFGKISPGHAEHDG